jgi:transcriptional regulator GlxA family with amidase domain
MNIQNSTTLPSRSFCFLLLPRFSNHCLANALEPLRAANMLSGKSLYRWQLSSLDGNSVASSSGLEVRTPHRFAEITNSNVLFLLSSYDYRRQTTPVLTRMLQKKARMFSVIGGLDTGSYALARAGLLDGYRATIHWQELDIFEETFPKVKTVVDRFVVDDDRITAGGATTALDLVLHLIGEQHGEALRLDVAGLFIYDRPHRGGDPQRMIPVSPEPGHAPHVARAVAVMESNLEEPLDIGEVCRRADCTQRELERRFQAALGTTPISYYRHLRVASARRMVFETDRRVAEIAVRTGFGSASALTRAFRQHYGDTPRRLRSSLHGNI